MSGMKNEENVQKGIKADDDANLCGVNYELHLRLQKNGEDIVISLKKSNIFSGFITPNHLKLHSIRFVRVASIGGAEEIYNSIDGSIPIDFKIKMTWSEFKKTVSRGVLVDYAVIYLIYDC